MDRSEVLEDRRLASKDQTMHIMHTVAFKLNLDEVAISKELPITNQLPMLLATCLKRYSSWSQLITRWHLAMKQSWLSFARWWQLRDLVCLACILAKRFTRRFGMGKHHERSIVEEAWLTRHMQVPWLWSLLTKNESVIPMMSFYMFIDRSRI